MFKVELGSDDFCNDSEYVKIGNVVKAIAGILLSNGSPNRFQAERNAWPYIHTGIEAGKLHPLAPETLDVLSIDHYGNGVVSFSELVEWGLWSHRFDFVTAGFETKTKTPALVGADEIDSSMVATRQQLTGLHEGRVMNYEPLAKLIEPYADGPFDKLPDGLRQRVIEAFSYQSEPFDARQWDELTPDGRRSLALQHDAQNDPAMEPENRYWRDLGSEIWATELKMTEWEKKDRRIPSEALIWEVKRAALGDRLSMLEGLWKLPPFLVTDWKALTDAALAEVVDNNIQTVQTIGITGDVGAEKATALTNRKTPKTLAFEAEVLRLMQKFWDDKNPGTEPNKSDLHTLVYNEMLRGKISGARKMTESMVRDAAKPWKQPILLPAFVPTSTFGEKRHHFKGDR